jgi:hypothetical protein
MGWNGMRRGQIIVSQQCLNHPHPRVVQMRSTHASQKYPHIMMLSEENVHRLMLRERVFGLNVQTQDMGFGNKSALEMSKR